MSTDNIMQAPARERVALVTGFTGQDGTFLTRLLLDKGYTVVGLTRRVSTEPPSRVRGKFDFSRELATGQLILESGDLLSVKSLIGVVRRHRPNEIYNLAAQSHVGISFKQPEFTIESILMGTVNLITALEEGNFLREWRMYQASTSEMFGDRWQDVVLDELSRFEPISPYAIAKAAAHQYCVMKRKEGRFISCGILFNHESEIRGGDFVTQKIARGVKRWQQTAEPLHLGNLNAQRDWGYAGDYVDAMWRMLQDETADDFVVATGLSYSVRDFVTEAFRCINQTIVWEGEGRNERGFINSLPAVVVDPQFYRPAEVGYLRGDYSKAQVRLGWTPRTTFLGLVRQMVEAAK